MTPQQKAAGQARANTNAQANAQQVAEGRGLVPVDFKSKVEIWLERFMIITYLVVGGVGLISGILIFFFSYDLYSAVGMNVKGDRLSVMVLSVLAVYRAAIHLNRNLLRHLKIFTTIEVWIFILSLYGVFRVDDYISAKPQAAQEAQQLVNDAGSAIQNFVAKGSRNVRVGSETTISSTKAPVYKSASLNDKVIGSTGKQSFLIQGDTVLVAEQHGDFVKVRFGDSFYYVRKSDI